MDWLTDFFGSLFQALIDGLQWLGNIFLDGLEWFFSLIANFLMDAFFGIAHAIISLLPDANPAIDQASGMTDELSISAQMLRYFGLMNLFIDLPFVMGVVGLVLTIQLIYLVISVVVWIKRFIPTMAG